MSRKQRIIRIGIGGVIAMAVVGAWAAMNATTLRAKVAARQLRTAGTDEARSAAADRLLALGDPGLASLVEFVRAGEGPSRATASSALRRQLAGLPEGSTWTSAAAGRLLDSFASSDEAGRRAILELIPVLLDRTGTTYSTRCREAVAVGLTLSDPESRLISVRLALHPAVSLRSEVVPLLADREPRVRRVALVAVATAAPGEAVVPDEDLFRWLHDPDEGVRTVCHDVLVSRDRSEQEIGLGRRLTNPDALERLKLLRDLRYDDFIADPEPWLERLSRDIEPAVRVGAARVAAEVSVARRLSCPPWVGTVADSDPDQTVRSVSAYYRSLPLRVAAGEILPAGGPQ